MMPKTKEQEFFQAVAPVALKVSEATGGRMLPETLLCQWADETGWDARGCWQGDPNKHGRNNLAGISPDGKLADYESLDEFAAAYVRVISQNAFGYPAVLAATNPVLQMHMLGRSEWAGSHYDASKTGVPGYDLVAIWQAYHNDIEAAISAARKAAKEQKAAAKEQPQQQQQPAQAAAADKSSAEQVGTVPVKGHLYVRRTALVGRVVSHDNQWVTLQSPVDPQDTWRVEVSAFHQDYQLVQ